MRVMALLSLFRSVLSRATRDQQSSNYCISKHNYLSPPPAPSTHRPPSPTSETAFPLIALSTVLLVSLVGKASTKGNIHYVKAGGVANEVYILR